MYNSVTDSYEEHNYFQPNTEAYDRYCEAQELLGDLEKEDKAFRDKG